MPSGRPTLPSLLPGARLRWFATTLGTLVLLLAGCAERPAGVTWSSGTAEASTQLSGVATTDATTTTTSAATTDATTADPDHTTARPILLLAAASLRTALTDLLARYREQTGVQVELSTGPSHALAQQIIAGAPADLFASAHVDWIKQLEDQQLVEQQWPWLSNRLVLIQPADAPIPITRPEDLLDPRIMHLALAGEQVPAGVYAQQALRHFHLWDRLAMGDRIVRGHDVVVTCQYVATGEADAGIVYATDARNAGAAVRIAYEFPANSHEPVIYPLAVLRGPHLHPQARAFAEWLLRPEQGSALQRAGFTPLPLEEPAESERASE